MKRQILIIHGGETFNLYDEYLNFLKNYRIDLEKINKKKWKDYIQEELGDEYEVIAPTMPSKYNAKYVEWKIWFEKFIPYLRDDVIFIGSSLGGTFLAKYLSENSLPIKIACTFLIAAPFDEKDKKESLADFILPKTLEKFESQAEKILLFHSEDDPIVPYRDFEKYSNALPKAEKLIFKDRGHFIQEEFQELIEKIKSI